MAPLWWAIAKAEHYAKFSKFHRRRTVFYGIIALVSVVWALFIVPWIISLFIDLLGERIQAFLMVALPGIMRSVILILWIMLLIFPLSGALQEIKIGQWEIILSHNVSTRALLTGSFVGGIPTNGLVVLFLAPVLITPFTTVFQVSVLGQAIIYGVLLLTVFGSLWVSTVIATAIQAKLGESSRGNDIAKGLSMLVVLIFLLPFYGLIYFAESLSNFMGMDIFLLLPSSWSADMITWSAIKFNGLNLPEEVIMAFETMLGFPVLLNFILLVVFSIGVVGIGILTADRLFNFGASGARSTVTTVGRENLFLRGLRRLIPGSFGVLVVTALKDFTRKLQNLSKLVYGMIIAIIAPVLQTYVIGVPFFVNMFQVSMMMGMMGALTFGGVGFLDSQDQLWIMKSAPKGVSKFVKARLVEILLFAIPIAVIPSLTVAIITGMRSWEWIVTHGSTYSLICGAALVGTGITANNPTYEDTKSGSFSANIGLSMIISTGTIILSLIAMIKVEQRFGSLVLMTLTYISPIVLIGVLICVIGTRRLARSDTV
ncbi:MAG: hypothetical protein ACE5R6_16015 [Candidatus Heimdallarchaeota archaeon]